MSDPVEPWLSVLMPVFNGAETLEAALQSVAENSTGVEVILVDQGSTDGSLEIAEAFRDKIDLHVVSAPQNKNWVENTNLALNMSRSDRATMLHQDDIWLPNRTGVLRDMIAQSPDAVLWLTSANYIDEKDRVIGSIAPPFGCNARILQPSEVLQSLLVQNTFALPACAFSVRAALDAGGLDEALWYTADWDLWLSLSKIGNLSWNPERTVAFRLHRNSLTINGSRNLEDFAKQLEMPVTRHTEALEARLSNSVHRMAKASNMLNVLMASTLHDSRKPMGPVIAAVLLLGPLKWVPFLRSTQLFKRVSPRIRLLRGRKSM